MAGSAEQIVVLHVEDEAGFADLAAECLEREDDRLVVETAHDAAAALDRMDERSYDCIVSDYEMPGRDGIEFLEAVRERDSDVPFILFTGKGSEEIASEAISAGVTDYLQKETGIDQYAVLANRITNAVDQLRAERAAERTERRLTELARSGNEILWMFTADWEDVLFINDAYKEIWGRPMDADEPTDFLAGIHPADRERTRRAMERLSAGEPIELELRVNEAEGYDRWVWVQGQPITDESGEVVRVAGFGRDITDRVSREQALEELHAVAMELPSYDTEEAVCERVVEAAENILEFDLCVVNLEEDGMLPVAAVSEELPEGGVTTMSVDEGLVGKTYRAGESIRVDDVHEASSANPQGPYVSALSIPVARHGVFQAVSEEFGAFDEEDRELAELLVSHAVRELDRIAYERTLEQYETIVEASGDGIYATDAEGRYTLVNDAFCELTGYDRTELVGTQAKEVVSSDSYERNLDRIRKFLSSDTEETQSTDEITITTADGEIIPCEDSLALLPTENGDYRGVAGIVRDISDRKARQQELEQYETMVNAVGDMVYILDTDGVIRFVNDAAEDLTGYDRERLLDAHIGLLAAEEDIEEGQMMLEALLEEGPRATEAYQWTLTTADGDRLPVESQLSLLYDDDGVAGSAGVVRDVSNRLERERELERRNERLDKFASVVSHDLRNPLNVAVGRLRLARDEHDSDHLATVANALDRMDTLIDDLLTLAREGRQVGEVTPVALDDAADRCWRNVATAEATLAIETDRTVLADNGRLNELFENLLRNSIEHGGSAVTVTVGALSDGFYVADDGPGIPPSDREQVFEQGYSTSETGTGFGLAIAREIAEAHGWSISVTDSESGGARFEIRGVESA